MVLSFEQSVIMIEYFEYTQWFDKYDLFCFLPVITPSDTKI